MKITSAKVKDKTQNLFDSKRATGVPLLKTATRVPVLESEVIRERSTKERDH